MIDAANKIKAAKTAKDALVILAHCIDAIDQKLEVLASNGFEEELEWEEELAVEVDKAHGPWTKEAKAIEATAEQIEAIRAAMAAATDPEDYQALEARLALATDTGRPGFVAPADTNPSIIRYEADGVIIDLPPVSKARQKHRRALAKKMDLGQNLGLDKDIAIDAFAKGGPLWLYYAGPEGRDLILGLPRDWRIAMINDVLEDAPNEAHEMGRDILKGDEDGSDTQEMTIAALDNG